MPRRSKGSKAGVPKISYGHIWRNGSGWAAQFCPSREERIIVYCGRCPHEAELAIALAKAEWLYRRLCDEVGRDRARRLLSFLDFARAYLSDVGEGSYGPVV